MRLPHSVPSSRKQASSVTVTARPPSDTLLPTGRPGAGAAVGDGHRPLDPLGADGRGRDRGMHVVAVADDLRRHGVLGQDGAGQAGGAVRERRHPVEQVGGVAGSGGDPASACS